MKTIYNTLHTIFKRAFNTVGIPSECPILLELASKEEFGDFQVNGVMKAAKLLKKNPRELAIEIIKTIDNTKSDIIAKLDIAGYGFINITLTDNFLAQYVLTLNRDNKYGVDYLGYIPQVVVIDYSSPNLAKEMHVGHLRSTVIGDALCRILQYLGNKVTRQNHVGDWGTQFGMLIAYMLELSDDGNKLEHNLSDLEDFYRKAKVRYDEDEAFQNSARQYVVILQNWRIHGEIGKKVHEYWKEFTQVSLNHCQKIYDELNVLLTKNDVAPESMYNDNLETIVKVLDNKHLLKISGGAKCVFFDNNELEGGEDTPFIVQKKDGGFLYATTDLAAIDYRTHTLGGQRLLYVVDNRQSLHFKQLFIIAKKAAIANSNTTLTHVQFGTMMGEDGKPFKTRTGGTVKLVDLITEAQRRALEIINDKSDTFTNEYKQELAQKIAIASIKYADLSKNRTSDYIFSFDKMLSFEGNTAPYLLYAYTRIQSLLTKVSCEFGFNQESYLNSKIIITKNIEHKLCLVLSRFVDIIQVTAQECYPHYLCQYLYNLSGIFMQFYETCNIVKESNIEFMHSRLILVQKVSNILQLGLELLGITTVNKM